MIVADTNLVAALLLPSEQTRVAEAVFRRDADWAAPLLWRPELRNVLAGEIRRGRLDHGGALALMRQAEEHMTGAEYAVERAAVLRLVATSRCSAYDCEFAALADDLGVPLVTSDRLVLGEFPDLARSPEAFLREPRRSTCVPDRPVCPGPWPTRWTPSRPRPRRGRAAKRATPAMVAPGGSVSAGPVLDPGLRGPGG